MDARYVGRTRNYLNEVKYETQIYWFVIISLFLAFAAGYGAIKDANSSVDKKIQLPATIFSDSSIASEAEHAMSRPQFTRNAADGRIISYQGGT